MKALLRIIVIAYSTVVIADPQCVTVLVKPGEVYSWTDFLKSHPPYSIALDGYVSAPTRRRIAGPYANFDHHYRVDRYSTRSTSAQVAFEIRMGLFNTFQRGGSPRANVFVNDCDEDVCLAVWLLRNHAYVLSTQDPDFEQFLAYEDLLDTSAGMYPVLNPTISRLLAWIFEPYRTARLKGSLQHANAGAVANIVDQVGDRITLFADGKGTEVEVDARYEVIGGGKNWKMIREIGPQARIGMLSAGVKAFVTDLGSGRFVIGKSSEWIRFPLQKFFAELNRSEPPGLITDNNRWGGSSTIGGSPRASGSKLSSGDIERIVNSVLEGI